MRKTNIAPRGLPALCALLLVLSPLPAQSGERLLVRITGGPKKMEALARMPLDFASSAVRKDALEAVVTQEEMNALLAQGYRVAILQRESDLRGFPVDLYYHTCEQTCEALRLVELQYPHIVKRFLIGQSTRFGHPIWALKISDNPGSDEDEIAVLVDGMHHAREVITHEICLAFIDYLVTGYGLDPRATSWVNDYEIWVIPILNPEGYKYIVDNRLESPWWRKNLRDNNENGKVDADYDGVDLNRNYDINWTWGGNPNPADWTYRGPAPFSEEETRAKRDLARREKFAASVTYHSYGEVVMYQWSWPDTGTTAPDHAALSKIATEMAQAIKRLNSAGTYSTSRQTAANQSSPWMYAALGTFEYLVEVGTSFVPLPADIKPLVEANLEGLYYFLNRLKGPGITGKVLDAQTGEPLEAVVAVRGIDDFNYIQPRRSDPRTGRFIRYLEPGTYTLLIYVPGYPYAGATVEVGSSLMDITIPMLPSLRAGHSPRP